jgi:protoheme IX farnesyltransferase
MNEPIEPILAPVVLDVTEDRSVRLIEDVMMLTKARLSTFVLITTFVGFLMASGNDIDWFLLFRTLFGTAFVAASAAVLNQFMERHVDRLMPRTRNRPLPSGRMQPETALGLGVLLAAAGLVYLTLRVNSLAASLAGATLGIYLFCYTPMKRRSPWCVSIGAISGAIPPMIGWVGARPSLNAGAWILFGILFFWQMPHFLAIAWMYRDEYAQAGFVMLRRKDIDGVKTALEAVVTAILLLAVTLLPAFMKLALPFYGVTALICNLLVCWCAVRFFMDRSRANARRMFFASIFYLPVLLALLVFCKA